MSLQSVQQFFADNAPDIEVIELSQSTATVALTVTSVDDAPVAVEDSYTVAEDDSLTVSIPGVLGNDSLGGDGGTLAVSSKEAKAL